RRLFLGFGLLALTGVAVVVWLAFQERLASQGRINEANFKLIQYGMTLAEVEAILGPPDPSARAENDYYEMDPGRIARWRTSRLLIDLVFDATGRVDGKIIETLDDSLIARIRRWLGL